MLQRFHGFVERPLASVHHDQNVRHKTHANASFLHLLSKMLDRHCSVGRTQGVVTARLVIPLGQKNKEISPPRDAAFHEAEEHMLADTFNTAGEERPMISQVVG